MWGKTAAASKLLQLGDNLDLHCWRGIDTTGKFSIQGNAPLPTDQFKPETPSRDETNYNSSRRTMTNRQLHTVWAWREVIQQWKNVQHYLPSQTNWTLPNWDPSACRSNQNASESLVHRCVCHSTNLFPAAFRQRVSLSRLVRDRDSDSHRTLARVPPFRAWFAGAGTLSCHCAC